MRKSLLSLLLMVLALPMMVMAENTAITKDARTSMATVTDTRAYVSTAMLGGGVDGTPAASYSVGAWVNIGELATVPDLNDNVASNNIVIFGHGGREHLNDNGEWNLVLNKEGVLQFTGWGTKMADTNTGVTLKLGEFHHLICSYDASVPSMTLYVDGAQAWTTTLSEGYKWFTNEHPAIYFAGYDFNGSLDEAQLWNKALSAEDAQRALVSAQRVDGLVGLYTFDEVASGTTGQFANMSKRAPYAENMIYESVSVASAYYCWGNGLVYLIDGVNGTHGTITEATVGATNTATGRVIPPVTFTVPAASDFENVKELTFTLNGEVLNPGDVKELENGTEISMTVVPADDYVIASVLADRIPVTGNGNGTFCVYADMTKDDFQFNIGRYVTLTVVDGGATVAIADNAGTAMTDLTKMVTTSAYKATVTLPDNLELTAVKLDGVALTGANGVYEFTMPEADATLTVETAEVSLFTVTIEQPAQGGTVAVAKGTATVNSGDKFVANTALILSNTPASGYRFVNYLVNGQAKTSATLVLTSDVTISAVFEESTAAEYCVLEGNSTWTAGDARGINDLTVADNNGNSVSVPGTSTAKAHAMYTDQTSKVITTTAGSTLTVTPNGTSNWMMHYLYIDFDNNGVFDVDQANTGVNGDLVSHTGYTLTMKAGNSDTADPTTWSDGTAITDWGEVCNKAMPTVTLPSDMAPGTYRVRYKLDWNSTNPCGRTSSNLYGGQKGNYITANAGVIIDFTLVIESDELEAPRDITIKANVDELGTVAFVNPESTETTISTTQKNVQVRATAAENCAFINWTNAAGEVVSTEADYTYSGEEAAELTANFGGMLSWTASEGGLVSVTVNGTVVSNNTVIAPGDEVSFTVTPEGSRVVRVFTVNGEACELTDGVYTFTAEGPAVAVIEFQDMTYTLNSFAVSGNGTAVFYAGGHGEEDQVINVGDGVTNATDYHILCYPGANEDGTETETMSIIIVNGENNIEDDGTESGDAWWDVDNEGTDCYVVPVVCEGNMEITVEFGEKFAAIGDLIFGDEEGVTEYFTLQGVKVSADNLTSGIYIVRKGSKTAKILIRK